MKPSASVTISLLLIVLFGEVTARADDWPQWRGPGRDGVWHETGVIEAFETARLPVRWSAPISSGYSGPTVAKGRVYVMDAVTKPEAAERVHCFDSLTGKAIWMHRYACDYGGLSFKAGPRASVTIDEGRAFSLGAMGHFHCLDAATGKVLWRKDLVREYHISLLPWGIAPSPLVEKDRVILQIGGGKGACVTAFDKQTGRERWTALDDPTSYASPIVVEQAGRRMLICWTGASIAGLDPNTGGIRWRHPFRHTHGWIDSIMTPAFDSGRLFASCAQDGAVLLRLTDDLPGFSVAWEIFGRGGRRAESFHGGYSSPVFIGKHLYGADSHGRLKCLSVESGGELWEDRTVAPQSSWSTAHIVRNGDKVWIFNEAGELVIGRLSPAGFVEISRAGLIRPTRVQFSKRSGVCWSHPAFADRHVFARNDEELVCASLAADDRAKIPRPRAAEPPRLVAPFSAEDIRRSQQAWAAHLGTPVEYTNMIGMRSVLIPPGEFAMGSSGDQVARLSPGGGTAKMPAWYADRIGEEAPRHRVAVTRPFYIGVFPVTVKDFRAFAKWGEYRPVPAETARGGRGYDTADGTVRTGPKYTWENPGFAQTDRHPVVNVSWNDAVGFCEFISSMEGDVCRLPTEAEWEYACRCGTILQWSAGDDESGLADIANVADASLSSLRPPEGLRGPAGGWSDGFAFTSPAGEFRPNAFGLFDLHGNVWEWCRDWHDPKAYDHSPRENPTGPATGTERVLRGGSWSRAPSASRSAFRHRAVPSERDMDVGFRVVQTWR